MSSLCRFTSRERLCRRLVKVKEAFENVVSKHETYANLIVDDKEVEKEENWLDECQNYFLKIDIDAKGYIEHVSAKVAEISLSENPQQSSRMTGMIGMQNADSANNMNPLVTEETKQSAGDEVNDVNDGPPAEISSESFNTIAEVTPNNLEQSPSQIASRNCTEVKSCSFQIEKPKLPKFSGDVREYAIFRADFNHLIESRYTKRDSIALLRTCLKEKPLELIKGVGSDYDAAWEYLDSIYGDPRFVSDTITQDIVKFKASEEGEDALFCDLVHLVRRCYNTLKEVGLPSDMDNSHMLSIIEQSMIERSRKRTKTRHSECINQLDVY